MPDREPFALPSSNCLRRTQARSAAAAESTLRDGLGLDSVDVVSVVSQIERQVPCAPTHEELEKLVTVRRTGPASGEDCRRPTAIPRRLTSLIG